MKRTNTTTRARIRRWWAAAAAALALMIAAAPPVHATIVSGEPIVQTRTITQHTAVPVYVDGVRCPRDAYIIENGVTFMPLRALAELLLPNAAVYWDSAASAAAVRTDTLTLRAVPGECYITANGRYLALSALYPAQNTLIDGVTYVPLRTAVRAMGGSIEWNAARGSVDITRGSGTIASGDTYYDADALYWLSRIIYAEAGDQSLRGQLAVGAVVMNRVASAQFPNTIYGVIFDRKWGVQFTPVANGAIYKPPSAQSILAAKLVLDGCLISDNALYFLDPTLASSFWIVENRQALFSIGCHDFYS